MDIEPPSEEEIDEARKQRITNMTDKRPELAKLMTGLTWGQIYKLVAGHE